MSWYDDLTEGDVEEFFGKYGDSTVAVHDLGYGCTLECTVEDLYHIFKKRMELENNSE